jgi:hypothetical protein
LTDKFDGVDATEHNRVVEHSREDEATSDERRAESDERRAESDERRATGGA